MHNFCCNLSLTGVKSWHYSTLVRSGSVKKFVFILLALALAMAVAYAIDGANPSVETASIYAQQ
jgi:hypothetical protein